MGNSFKLIKWIGIGAVVLLVIALGMTVIKGFEGFMSEDSDKLEIGDLNEFNNKFAPYKGKITGTKVRQLCNVLVNNIDENKNNAEKLPDIAYQLTGGADFEVINSTVDKTNEKEIKAISVKFDTTYSYTVEFVYSEKGLITGIIIKHNEKEKYTFEQLVGIIAELRSDHGCPWDRAQTHESMIKCLRDECEEVVEAIENKDDENLCEELGDVLLQVLLHAQIATEEKRFDINDVIDGLSKKMIRRHPHVFGGAPQASTPEEGLANWKAIKEKEKEAKKLAQKNG